MWNAVSSVASSLKNWIFGTKRKRNESDTESLDCEEQAPKKARRNPSSDIENELMNGNSKAVPNRIRHGIPNASKYDDVSDDESDVDVIENDQKPIKSTKYKENVVDLVARDHYARLLQHWTPDYRRRLTRPVYRTLPFASEPRQRAVRSVLFRGQRQFNDSASVKTPIRGDSNDSWIQDASAQTKAHLERIASPLLDTLDRPTADESSVMLDWKHKDDEQQQQYEETSSVGSNPACDHGLLDSLKATVGSTSTRSSGALENQEAVSSESVSIAETSSNGFLALSQGESRSLPLKRYTSLEKLDELCSRSPLTDLNGKFRLCDPLLLRMDIKRNSQGKARREEGLSKLRAEAELRRSARLSIQKSVEDEIRLRMRLEGLLIEEKEVKVEFVQLTEEQLLAVKRAIAAGRADDVMVEAFNARITRHDLQTLTGLNWLNDEVINFFMSLIVERGGKQGLPKVYAMNTFFYPKLMQNGHSALKRWTRKVDIFSYDLILVPVHLGIHWCLAVVDMRSLMISYYDSMGGSNEDGLQAMLTYLQDECLEKKKAQLDISDWQLCHVKDIPRQYNGSDCGMFVCRFAEYISRDARISFTQDHMPYFRRRTIYEILTKSLL